MNVEEFRREHAGHKITREEVQIMFALHSDRIMPEGPHVLIQLVCHDCNRGFNLDKADAECS